MSLLLTKSEQGIVIFHIWKNLKYGARLVFSMILIVAGFSLQYYMFDVFPGIVLVLAGNLFLLVKGYDSRIKLGKFEQDTEWASTDLAHLEQVVTLNNKIRKWDISALDITSGLGVIFFLLFMAGLFGIVALNPFHSLDALFIVIGNAVVLIFPHWFTGVKRSTTAPALVNKIKLYKTITEAFSAKLEQDTISFLMLLKGKDQKLPADVKMKIKLKNQPKDFLGIYAQISMNNLQGQDYPYFYMVLVVKESSRMISKGLAALQMPPNVITEFSHQDDTEILVIRQYTTKDSGYFTDDYSTSNIFNAGLETARNLSGNYSQV